MFQNRLHHSIFQLPQNYVLLVATGAGFIGFVLSMGLRSIVLGVGIAIALGMWAAWVWQLKSSPFLISKKTQDNLLDIECFQEQLERLEKKLDVPSRQKLEKVRFWIRETQSFARKIAEIEPELVPDLIEMLYTVLALADRAIVTTLANQQIRTLAYQKIGEQNLKASCDRIQATHHQLQEFHDRLVLNQVGNQFPDLETVFPDRLQLLLAQNKEALQTSNELNERSL
ncbi:hypothetical protein IQ235_16400 [Oscillatoriales cyanobacterium LEGE 11467]|uniref:Uncharacterized protein n=1 Tax=Zarconia navalis LEGE 11467 TaxID=1828826 RepID=A0A928Z980_9CYAN|nr:hypothetical protein [Zarconia navalis]MBE9042355.1 hypothetical protein [Zarconia navalis LEGE 11467]